VSGDADLVVGLVTCCHAGNVRTDVVRAHHHMW
jgi:hypothetical protein